MSIKEIMKLITTELQINLIFSNSLNSQASSLRIWVINNNNKKKLKKKNEIQSLDHLENPCLEEICQIERTLFF